MKKVLLSVVFSIFFTINAHAEILVGVSGPFSGGAASYGEQIKAGVKVALNEINVSGGVLGQELKPVYEDDACDGKQGVAAANKLVGQEISGVVGLFCSMVMMPAADIYAEENIPVMFSASSPKITGRGHSNIFRINGKDDQQTKILAAYIKQHFPGKKVALIDDKQTWGKGIVEYMESDLADLGIRPSLLDSINIGEKDFTALITKMKKQKIDVVVLGVFPVEAGLIARQSADLGFKPAYFGADGMLSTEYSNIAGKAGDGLIFTGPADPRLTEAGKAIVAKIKASGDKAELYSLYAYTQLKVLAEAINLAGAKDNQKIIEALRGNSFKTVLGDVSFDKTGNVKKPLWTLYKWKDGDYVPISESM